MGCEQATLKAGRNVKLSPVSTQNPSTRHDNGLIIRHWLSLTTCLIGPQKLTLMVPYHIQDAALLPQRLNIYDKGQITPVKWHCVPLFSLSRVVRCPRVKSESEACPGRLRRRTLLVLHISTRIRLLPSRLIIGSHCSK